MEGVRPSRMLPAGRIALLADCLAWGFGAAAAAVLWAGAASVAVPQVAAVALVFLLLVVIARDIRAEELRQRRRRANVARRPAWVERRAATAVQR